MPASSCLICESQATYNVIPDGTWTPDGSRINPPLYYFHCSRCGNFYVAENIQEDFRGWSQEKRINLSGWIRENQNCIINNSNLQPLGELRKLTIGEKAERLLEYLAVKYPKLGENIELFEKISHELQAICRARDHKELTFLMTDYLHNEKSFLLYSKIGTDLGSDVFYRISPAGWSHIDSKRQANPNSRIGFIAMWFSESVNDAWLAIDKGISAAGYEPFRVDQKQHNNKIDDEIIAGIRGSKFLVADLTDHRGGVYYEAGFAQGLGLEVIWLCRKSDLEEMHFDIRQYNCIVWEHDKLDDLTKALKVRIEARFGHGPINEVAGP